MLSIGSVFAGRFEVVSVPRVGTTSRFCHAREVGSTRMVFLRVLDPLLSREDPSWAQRVARNAPVFRDLAGPHHEVFVAAGECDGRCFVASELLRGRTLRAAMTPGQPLPSDETLRVLWAVSHALAQMHRAGIISRQVRAETVFLADSEGGDAVVKLFDQTRWLRRLAIRTNREDEAIVLGSESPEVIVGERPTMRSDVYSWGLMAHELFTGRRVFEDLSVAARVIAQVKGPPPTLDALAPTIHPLIARTLSRDPAERPADGAELLRACDEMLRTPLIR